MNIFVINILPSLQNENDIFINILFKFNWILFDYDNLLKI